MSKKINKFTNDDIDKIIDLYINQNKSLGFIAKQFDCSRPTISNKLKENNIKIRQVKKREFNDIEINDIIYKHLTCKLSATAIAKSYNCDHKTIQNLLKKENIKPKIYRNMKAKLSKLDEMEITNKYNLGASMKHLANEYKTSKSNISKILKTNNVYIESNTEIYFNNNDINDIINKYKNELYTLAMLAYDYNCSHVTISNLLKKNNIKVRKANCREELPVKYYELEGIKCNSIYMYRNIINNKVYIGMTNDTKARHKAHLRKMKTGNESIYQAFRKYGIDNFEYKVLENNLSREEANKLEIKYIEKYNSYYNGYNQTHGGENYNYIIVTEDMQNKIINMYTKDKLSKREICNELKYSYRLINEVLNTYAKDEVINRRPNMAAYKAMSDDKIKEINEKFINQFYKKNVDIASEYNININTLNYILNDGAKDKKKQIKNKVKSLKVEKAKELAFETDLTIKEISEIVCLDRHSVSKELKKNL